MTSSNLPLVMFLAIIYPFMYTLFALPFPSLDMIWSLAPSRLVVSFLPWLGQVMDSVVCLFIALFGAILSCLVLSSTYLPTCPLSLD